MVMVLDRDATGDDNDRDSIFALSSGPPPAGVAVIRASGPSVRRALQAMIGGLPDERRATLRTIVDPRSGMAIDRGLVFFFPRPESFTGEDVAEFQVHGGRAVVAAALGALGSLTGFRIAEPGEFTRRAFVAGRMDLTEAEGVADIVAADTEAQRLAALRQSGGSIRRQIESWAAALIRARGLIEAELDFSDEEGVAGAWAREGRELASSVAEEMQQGVAGFEKARSVREGLEIVLLGPVNVGKSTLMNAIAGRDVAIVSEEAGTTRDLIEVVVDLSGHKATLIDSAGLRETEGAVEEEGVRRARARASEADLVLWLTDSVEGAEPGLEIEPEFWKVRTKADLDVESQLIRVRNGADHVLSGKTGHGVDQLLAALADWALARGSGEPGLISRLRQRNAIGEAALAASRAVAQLEPELAAEHLREATNALGRVTGRIDAEAVLDAVFSQFCIGK